MTKREMAKECMAAIYNVPLHAIPDDHPTIRGYMHLPKSVLELKHENRFEIRTNTTTTENVK